MRRPASTTRHIVVSHAAHQEAVFLLPGSIFKCPNFVRLVISAPIELLHETAKRITEFCARHRREHHTHDAHHAHHTHGAHAPATTAPVP